MTNTTFFYILVSLFALILLGIITVLSHNSYKEKNSAFECGFHSLLGQKIRTLLKNFLIFLLCCSGYFYIIQLLLYFTNITVSLQSIAACSVSIGVLIESLDMFIFLFSESERFPLRDTGNGLRPTLPIPSSTVSPDTVPNTVPGREQEFFGAYLVNSTNSEPNVFNVTENTCRTQHWVIKNPTKITEFKPGANHQPYASNMSNFLENCGVRQMAFLKPSDVAFASAVANHYGYPDLKGAGFIEKLKTI